jgi:hypothetical protein
LQLTPSKITAGVFIRLNCPVFSSTKRSTRVLTRNTLSQNGTSSASNQRALFDLLTPSVGKDLFIGFHPHQVARPKTEITSLG